MIAVPLTGANFFSMGDEMRISSIPFSFDAATLGNYANYAFDVSEKAKIASLVSGLPINGDAIFFVNTGQSNAFGSNGDGKLPDDFELNDNVFAYDRNTKDFVVSAPKHYQGDGDKYDTQISWAHALAVRLQKETGKKVYYLQYAYGSKSIVNWTNDTSDPSNLPDWDFGGSIIYHTGIALGKLSQHGISAPHFWIWGQGEDDAGRPHSWYASQFKTMIERFENAGLLWRGITPILCWEPLRGGYGEPMIEFFRNMPRYGIDYATFVTSDGLSNDGVTKVHMSSDSYWEYGYWRLFSALVDAINSRSSVASVNPASVPPASSVPRNMVIVVNDQNQPYIAVSDGSSLKKANMS